MIVKSYAKINLVLYVLNKRPDGYHDIISIITKVDFFDLIEIKPSGILSVLTNKPELNNNSNLAFRSAKKFFEESRIKDAVKIDIQKHIPLEAGLGGGSSNAAYTLLALNKMYDYVLSFDKLLDISLQLGSDCPFFLYENANLVCSKGEQVYPLDFLLKPQPIIIVKPEMGVSTKLAYSNLILTKRNNINKMTLVDRLKKGGPLAIMHNDLESSVFKLYPAIEYLKRKIYEIAQNALLCGSGSSVFAFAENCERQQIISMLDDGYFFKTTTILNNEGRDLYGHYRS
ncbi:4-diphosphocytidyl-2-C-methyl-D-erythritol kinase [Desulfurella amilsii]|uniref:4-diphosphocytidyl-2-C-methyl-D-erythritol kinase n=1 Tax=Desulfurella amilsii TaxID=1562698 RepID=A0A1X4XXY0_9BACT|nr:4-(cytidine 5'-diphospho)-2-C-methyl-D-erythritol kinase [Desulfurella amilsii]OSS42387.1 4-diphosphocytidyl-2-C-methyl-D-erythritol kinase [Desulfurella amilsii]